MPSHKPRAKRRESSKSSRTTADATSGGAKRRNRSSRAKSNEGVVLASRSPRIEVDRYVPNSEGCAVATDGAFGAYSALWSPAPAVALSPSALPITAPNASPVIRASGAIVDALCSLNQTPQHNIVYEQPSPFSSFVMDSQLPSHELEQLKRELEMEAVTALARQQQLSDREAPSELLNGTGLIEVDQHSLSKIPGQDDRGSGAVDGLGGLATGDQQENQSSADAIPTNSPKNRGLDWFFTVASVENQRDSVDFEDPGDISDQQFLSFTDEPLLPQPLHAESVLVRLFGKSFASCSTPRSDHAPTPHLCSGTPTTAALFDQADTGWRLSDARPKRVLGGMCFGCVRIAVSRVNTRYRRVFRPCVTKPTIQHMLAHGLGHTWSKRVCTTAELTSRRDGS